ncbi:DUF3768 domain-containing protein [Methylobacterium sp. WL12]|uniref:DUF3768 domain-containing protein n=1 Tax=Methylobacterium sp. WL12 TaxID=2603890 RepID=UPI0011C9476A|nr:DUF3768 domain-containing protein [Methylobacterium sp. WL12]TXM67549.1 DUF3768 domain-containing protein [Methylobacterium sp. WL12]
MEQTSNTNDPTYAWLGPNDTPSRVAHRARIRALNDDLRCNGEGGRVLVTASVAKLSPALQTSVLTAVATFTTFAFGNDPYGEHDFGAVTVEDEVYFWKIDSYDTDLVGHSPDPADPAVTARVLTIMHATEY